MTGNEIRQMREGMNLGRVAFGKLLDVSREVVRSWEKDRRCPNPDNMTKLLKLQEENNGRETV